MAVLALRLAGAAARDGTIGPGDAHAVVHKAGYRVEISITPNRGALIPSTYRRRRDARRASPCPVRSRRGSR